MRERGLEVDHSTIFRWVQRYAPEINKRIRQHLKMSGTSYRVDETYIKVGKTCKYLYRAVDKEGQTIEFRLSAKCNIAAAKRFFRKMMRAGHRRLPFSISVDKNAAYPEAFTSLQAEKILPSDCQLRRMKYLNNVIEQDHRFIKKKVGAGEVCRLAVRDRCLAKCILRTFAPQNNSCNTTLISSFTRSQFPVIVFPEF